MMMTQNRQPMSAARWNSRVSGPQLPTAKNSLTVGTGVLLELEEMTKTLNLGTPTYKVAGGTGSGRGYFCSVNIGGHHAGSLDEYVTTEQAQCAAALNAMNLLKTYYADSLASLQNNAQQQRQNSSNSNDDQATLSKAIDVDNKISNEKKAEPRTERIVSDDFERIVENLLILLENMPRGIYSHALATKYHETYQQNLPPEWLSKIKDGYPEFVVDEVDSFRSIVAKRRHVKSAPKLAAAADGGADLLLPKFTALDSPIPTTPTVVECAGENDSNMTTTHEAVAAATAAVAVPPPQYLPKLDEEATANGGDGTKKSSEEQVVDNNSRGAKVRFSESTSERVFTRQSGEDEEIIHPPPIQQPPAFTLPEDTDRWHVFVSVVKTPADFTIRVLGEEYSEQYEQLQRDMQEYYETKDLGRKLDFPSSASSSYNESTLIGGVYAARAEECWHRVYLNEIIPADEGIADEGVTASVYFIDHGDYETIPFDDLRILEQNFMRLPCQATTACLVGFEQLALQDLTQDVIDRFRELTLGKILAAQYVDTTAVPPEAGEFGRLRLLLATPVSSTAPSEEVGGGNSEQIIGGVSTAVVDDGGDNSMTKNNTLPAPQNQAAAAPMMMMINELITQMMPKSSISKLAAGARNPTAAVNGTRTQ